MKTRNALAIMLMALALAAPAYARGKKPSTSTAPGHYKEWGPDIDEIDIKQTFHAADYSMIVLTPFDTSAVTLPDKDDNTYVPVKNVLASATEVLILGLRSNVPVKVVIEDHEPKRAGVLLIRCKVLEVDPGSRAARYFAGFGAGAARVKLSGEIVDAKSGDVLATFTQERRSAVGNAGGSYESLLGRDLGTIGEDIANLLKMFS